MWTEKQAYLLAVESGAPRDLDGVVGYQGTASIVGPTQRDEQQFGARLEMDGPQRSTRFIQSRSPVRTEPEQPGARPSACSRRISSRHKGSVLQQSHGCANTARGAVQSLGDGLFADRFDVAPLGHAESGDVSREESGSVWEGLHNLCMSYATPVATPTTARETDWTPKPRASSDGGVTAVLCGSFRRDVEGLRSDYRSLVEMGCRVLSPLTLDWALERDGFVFSAAEEAEDPRDIEQRHLTAMRQAHFVWLHSPAGYVGRSAAMEVGYAHALGLPIFTRTLPEDITLAGLVRRIDAAGMAIATIRSGDISAPAYGLDALQRYYQRAAEARGWSHEAVQECLAFLQGELEELTEAIRVNGQGSYEAALEMADVQLYVAHLANITGIDLARAVVEKEHINTERFGPVVPPGV